MIPKCRECENTEFQDMNGRPNRWYCKHPEVRAHVSCPADTLICKTERYSTEITIKTSPKWCPRRKKQMIDVIVAMGVGVLIGAFGVIAWALSAVNNDRGEKDDRDQAGKGNGPESH